MGNCTSLSDVATSEVAMKSGTTSDGSEEAAMVFSNGIVSSSRVSVSLFLVIQS